MHVWFFGWTTKKKVNAVSADFTHWENRQRKAEWIICCNLNFNHLVSPFPSTSPNLRNTTPMSFCFLAPWECVTGTQGGAPKHGGDSCASLFPLRYWWEDREFLRQYDLNITEQQFLQLVLNSCRRGWVMWRVLRHKVKHVIVLLMNVAACFIGGFWADRTVLHEAASHGRTLQLQELIKSGWSVNTVTVDNITPLHEACIQARPNCARLLLEAGAQVGLRCGSGGVRVGRRIMKSWITNTCFCTSVDFSDSYCTWVFLNYFWRLFTFTLILMSVLLLTLEMHPGDLCVEKYPKKHLFIILEVEPFELCCCVVQY